MNGPHDWRELLVTHAIVTLVVAMSMPGGSVVGAYPYTPAHRRAAVWAFVGSLAGFQIGVTFGFAALRTVPEVPTLALAEVVGLVGAAVGWAAGYVVC